MTTGRWVDDMISSEAGRSGQEAKRRRAARLRKGDRDFDRLLQQLDREAKIPKRIKYDKGYGLFRPVRPPRRSK